jgi:hypothetical protein
MTLLEKDADWPTTLRVDSTTKMPQTVERSIDYIVTHGVFEWQRKYGYAPTDLIFGRKACMKLREYLAGIPMISREVFGPTNEFMGLTFHRDWECEGIKIFGDL